MAISGVQVLAGSRSYRMDGPEWRIEESDVAYGDVITPHELDEVRPRVEQRIVPLQRPPTRTDQMEE